MVIALPSTLISCCLLKVSLIDGLDYTCCIMRWLPWTWTNNASSLILKMQISGVIRHIISINQLPQSARKLSFSDTSRAAVGVITVWTCGLVPPSGPQIGGGRGEDAHRQQRAFRKAAAVFSCTQCIRHAGTRQWDSPGGSRFAMTPTDFLIIALMIARNFKSQL